MHLIQLFLPVNAKASGQYETVRRELTERFGGMTAFVQVPAEGFWKDESNHVSRDQIAVIEVMTPTLDRDWWNRYRHDLEQRFKQDSLVIRTLLCDLL